MARILTVGIATLDIINSVAAFPAEDDEMRAQEQNICRGGNASNSAVVLAQLGHECSWAGTLADDASSELIRADLAAYRVNMSAVQLEVGGRAPTSYVTLNQKNGSRTIVHYRQLAEYSFAAFAKIDLSQFDWLHFEGRNVEQTIAMLRHARQLAPQLPVSVEIEKPRENIEALCSAADLLLYSRIYAQQALSCDEETPETFLRQQWQRFPAAEHSCTWGALGAWAINRQGELKQSAVPRLSVVVDTLGAGDTFNAAMIHAKLAGQPLQTCLQEACRLATKKCAQSGLSGLCV
jgi:ketohexokinase